MCGGVFTVHNVLGMVWSVQITWLQSMLYDLLLRHSHHIHTVGVYPDYKSSHSIPI